MKTYYEASIFAIGVKKRCRKVDRHLIKLDENISIDNARSAVEQQEIVKQAITKIDETMKQTRKATLTLNYMKEEHNGRFNCVTWQPFDDRNIELGVIYGS